MGEQVAPVCPGGENMKTAVGLFPNIQKTSGVPKGYVSLEAEGRRAVVSEWAIGVVADVLAMGTLYEWAGGQANREEMRGRGAVYAVDLPTDPLTPVVVRRNSHGGLLRNLTGEFFLLPTRAPRELEVTLRLTAAGIATPEVVAYGVYPVAGISARCDVMTRRLPTGGDAPALWGMYDESGRERTIAAMGRLLTSLGGIGAYHGDLNLKNIYLAETDGELTAFLLDVDRVTFPGADAAHRNFTRLARSIRKWRNRWGLDFTEDALARLAAATGENYRCE